MKKLNRRDFLKLASLVPGALALSALAPKALSQNAPADAAKPNVIILLFDAMSATNLSLYGYERDTTPNFKRFAEHANVYHSHNSPANFTSPGTASFLTGTYPWTHRAINIGGLISRTMLDHNLFHYFDDQYTRLAYSQNILDNYFLTQFSSDINRLLSPASFSAFSGIVGADFKDPAAYRAFDDFLFPNGNPPASLIFGLINQLSFRKKYLTGVNGYRQYPNGLPGLRTNPIYFELDKIFEGVFATLRSLQSPYLTYFHFWAPHAPYRPTSTFMETFNDKWKPEKKPAHPLSPQISQSQLNTRRANYDRYVANVDDEFGKLIDRLEQQGIFENSYVVVTSDHGEMFERGEAGHVTLLLSDPVIHIPLMISAPGQRTRVDIHTKTNAVDVLPTLLHVTGHPVPEWCEGSLLPGLGGKDDAERGTFSVEAKTNPAFAPLDQLSIAMRKGSYKLIHYKGYNLPDSFELYDTKNDPQELDNLYPQSNVAGVLKDELLEKLNAVNKKYTR
jgi:arylsulfatase A-like enzyme